MCETLLRQREDQIREEYDKILAEKLSGLRLSFNPRFNPFFRTIRGLLSVHAGPAAHAQVGRVLELHFLNYSQLATVAIVSMCSPV